jgi:hypothetical protein
MRTIKYALLNKNGRFATIDHSDNNGAYACNETTATLFASGLRGVDAFWETKEAAEYAKTVNTDWYNSSDEKPNWYDFEDEEDFGALKVVRVTMLVEEC